MLCPQAGKLSCTWEVTAAGINCDLGTVTKRDTEILRKPKPQLQEVVFKKLYRVGEVLLRHQSKYILNACLTEIGSLVL